MRVDVLFLCCRSLKNLTKSKILSLSVSIFLMYSLNSNVCQILFVILSTLLLLAVALVKVS